MIELAFGEHRSSVLSVLRAYEAKNRFQRIGAENPSGAGDVLDNLLDLFRRLFEVADMTLNNEDMALHHLLSFQDRNVGLFVSEFLR
jgi:hypothetical protein